MRDVGLERFIPAQVDRMLPADRAVGRFRSFPQNLAGRLRFFATVLLVVLLATGVSFCAAASDFQRARSLCNQAAKSYRRGDMPGASRQWSQALAIFKTFRGTEKQQAALYACIGGALGNMGKYEEEIARQEQALAIYRTIKGMEQGQAECHRSIGKALLRMGQDERCIVRQEQALAIFKTIQGTELQQAGCYLDIGDALGGMGKYRAKIASFEQAIAIFKTIQGTELNRAACHVGIGIVFGDMGKYNEEVAKQEQALAIYRTVQGTEQGQAGCYTIMGVAFSKMAKYQRSVACQEQALELYRQISGTERSQAECYQNIGTALLGLSRNEQGIAKYEQALEIYRKIPGTERDQAICCHSIGVALSRMNKHERCISRYRRALAIYKAIPGTARDQATCYAAIGAALVNTQDYAEAVAPHEQALSIYRTLMGTELAQAGCYKGLGVALGNIGRYGQAFGQQLRALKLYQQIGGTERDQADCYMNIGVALSLLHQSESAIANTERALKIYRSLKGTEQRQADCLVVVGGTLSSMDRHEEAFAKREEALAIYRTIKGTERQQADCHVNIGIDLSSMGQSERALVEYEQALAVYRTIKYTERQQAACHANLGVALHRVGQYEQAIAKYEQALSILKTITGTEQSRGLCYGGIGRAHLAAGRYSHAIISFRSAGGVGWWLSQGLSRAYRFRHEPGDSQKAVVSSLDAITRAEGRRTSVQAFEHRTAIFEEPAQIFRDFVGLLIELAQKETTVREPEVARWADDPGLPKAPLEFAFHYADRGKGRALEDALREKASLEGKDANINLLSEDKGLSLQISKLAGLREELPPSEAEQKNELTQQIDEFQQRRNMIEVQLKRAALGGYVAPEFRKPMEMARELPAETAVLQYSVGEEEGWLLILTRKEVTAHRVGAETPALPELLPRQEAALGQLAQAWQERPEKIGLEGLVQLARMRMEDLAKRASERHNLIDSTQEQAILARLGEVVLPDSARDQLRQEGIHHLLVIPDGALHYVPFAMLRVPADPKDKEQYLVERYGISYVPAMTTLETIRKHAQERQQKRKMERYPLLAFANPSFREGIVPSSDDMVTRLRSVRGDYYSGSGLRLTVLPETEREALRVASLFGPPEHYTQPVEVPESKALVCTREAASEALVKRWLGPSREDAQWQYLLFSTHGLADTRNGMLSCLALSSPSSDSQEDGFLQAQEIMGLKLDCDLVMLSACQTGLGRLRSGEGMVGLSGSFFYAGAESVCVSLWQVPTGPTSQLTAEFFRNLKAGKLDKAEALRRAQLSVLRSDQRSPDGTVRHSDPFCWAAFVLTGEWR